MLIRVAIFSCLAFVLVSCLAPSALTLPIFADGQSNACGRGDGGPSFAFVSSNVTVWNNENELGSNGAAFVTPERGEPPFDAGNGNNALLWAAHRLAKDTQTQMVLVCRGGTPIQDWIDEQGNPGPMLLEAKAVYDASGLPPAQVHFRHQGESNKFDDPQLFDDLTIASIQWLKDNGVLAQDAPTFLGGLYHAKAGAINDRMKLMAEREPLVYYVPHDGLPENGDAVHFSGEGLARFGYRYYAAYLEHFAPVSLNIDTTLVEERKPPNTAGGDFFTGALRTRELNTPVAVANWAAFDGVNHSVTITQPGIYEFRAEAIAYRTDRHQIFLYDVDESEVVAEGTPSFAKSDNNLQGQTHSTLSWIVEITEPTTFQLKHWADTSRPNTGLGVSSPSAPGRDGVMSRLTIRKID